MEEQEFSILTPNAMLGYGYRADHFWYGIETYKPEAIIVDSGSTDGGPYKLGMNKMTCGREAYIRDLTPMLEACFHHKIKVLIGSVGGDGSNSHVQEMLGIIKEISADKGFSFKIATISHDISPDLVKHRIDEGKCYPCGPLADLSKDDVDNAVNFVAQMGAEPFIKALEEDPDIILGGRSYDPAPFAGYCLSKGVSAGTAWHMGKIMECGGICSVPKGRSMIATMRKTSFDLVPLNPIERCTPLSVAAHTLYEKTRPDKLPGPGGVLHLDDASYEQLADDRTVRVSGAKFVPTPVYQIKLEGVQRLGHRTIFIGGVRDPILISQINEFLQSVREYSQGLYPDLDQSDNCRLIYHVYGNNAVMGPLEATSSDVHEIGVMGEVVAQTREKSYAIANNVRTSLLHMPYEGQLATTGNFASPLSPHEQDAGEVFKFSLYHLIDLEQGQETSLFPVTHLQVQGETQRSSEGSRLSEKEWRFFKETTPQLLTQKKAPEGEADMMALAKVIRSKNSGPFELTLDIMFDNKESYERVKAANILGNEVIKRLYKVEDQDILVNMFFDPAFAWKCTLKRPWAQGSIGERDTLGTQQHAPLLRIRVPAAIN
ncbi:hypothetical protein BGZ61DRAFT_362426 [Ilyonectria robusta]|uniref:uncharacterized protein n=1 Tax=Ilyonectria robusta TaxID=1079257 RepID=UPI001E8CB540|nr:uncharacterized protein BGZ61DRAFT_362426 [Ilyonectria robusta]KAH8672427.1 hypothetical protein BGZ61DRAFT_362426 [Ilyonectria robusta]